MKTFHFLLFNRWVCRILGREVSAVPLVAAEVENFFAVVRRNEAGPPYQMSGYKEIFIADFMEGTGDFTPLLNNALRDALSIVWDEFCREYEWVEAADMNELHSRFLCIQQ